MLALTQTAEVFSHKFFCTAGSFSLRRLRPSPSIGSSFRFIPYYSTKSKHARDVRIRKP